MRLCLGATSDFQYGLSIDFKENITWNVRKMTQNPGLHP